MLDAPISYPLLVYLSIYAIENGQPIIEIGKFLQRPGNIVRVKPNGAT